MSLKNPKALRKCRENLQPQMPELQFLKTLILKTLLTILNSEKLCFTQFVTRMAAWLPYVYTINYVFYILLLHIKEYRCLKNVIL